MKTYSKILVLLFTGLLFTQCTDGFEEMNTRPDAFTQDEVSAKFFVTNPQFQLYAPDRFPYWRAHLIHMDRFAGHFTFGNNGSWWNDGLAYTYNAGYTDASWGWLAGYIGNLDNFTRQVEEGGEFENEYMFAMALIMKGLYFQMYTDVFGMVPYTEASNPDIVTPQFDDQGTIYRGIIADLDNAMSIIGDEERTGPNVDDVGDNDLYYGGDLQKWKKLANTLKLRVAMRALGAPSENFAQAAITSALAAPLLETSDENALLTKDETISQWGSAAYGDVWYNFGRGSDWKVGKTVIDYLRNYDDPRLPLYAQPAPGGVVELQRPEGSQAAGYDKRVNFILGELDAAGVDYTREETDAGIRVTMPENAYYVGQPSRLNANVQPFVAFEFFSNPQEDIIRRKNEGFIRPEIIMTSAEAWFLRAEAAVRGLSGEDAQEMHQNGIRQAMELWGVSSGDIDTYLAESDLALLNGSNEENIEKIAIQRWLNAYTDGFEGFAIVRDMGFPAELANGVSDFDIYASGDNNGAYPQRLRYGNQALNTNGSNVAAAVSEQGADDIGTKLWFAK